MTRVALYNPLPSALFHYNLALNEVLCDIGVDVIRSVTVEGEPGGQARGRTLALLEHIRRSLLEARTVDRTIVIWPLLGWWECVIWSGQPQNFIIFHDPTPLRKQPGMTLAAKAAARAKCVRNRPTIIAHSQDAIDIAQITAPNLKAVKVPHPVRLSGIDRKGEHSGRTRIGVFGQFKEARDTAVLRGLSALNTTGAYDLRLTGRGWPSIEGWSRVSGFVSETEFDRQMDAVDVVLLPYSKYYQSGVALRALERGVPVVGKATSFMLDLYGDKYPGLVRESSIKDWRRAIEDVLGLDVGPFRKQYISRMRGGWIEVMRNADET